jgi:hypothetical protein
MILYRCDVCDKITENDILPSDWTILQLTAGSEVVSPHGVRHLCNDHTLDKLIAMVIAKAK